MSFKKHSTKGLNEQLKDAAKKEDEVTVDLIVNQILYLEEFSD